MQIVVTEVMLTILEVVIQNVYLSIYSVMHVRVIRF